MITPKSPDAQGEVTHFFKPSFVSRRNANGTGATGPCVPLVAPHIDSPRGAYLIS